MVYLKRTAIAVGGRDGSVATPNNSINLQLAKPAEMGGAASNKTNPEELFLAGYTTCLASSFEFLAAKAGMSYNALEVSGEIRLEEDTDLGGFKFAVDVTFSIVGLDDEAKKSLVEQTLGFCPFSKSIKNNVVVDTKIK